MGYIDIQHIAEICARFSGPHYYVSHMIPQSQLANVQDKIENARKSFPIPSNEYVVVLLDATLFNSGKNGLAICTSGLYWHNNWTVKTAYNYCSWEYLATAYIQQHDQYSLELGPDCIVGLASCPFDKNVLIQLLQELQRYVGHALSESNTTVTMTIQTEASLPVEDWMIAVAGQQYGPYDLGSIRTMVVTKQLVPEDTYVWRQGMAEWVLFLHIPGLAALVPPAMPPVPPALSQRPVSSYTSGPTASSPQEAYGLSADSIGATGSKTVNVNTASWESLLELPGIGLTSAKRLVQQRDVIGGFTSVEEMGDLLGLKPHQVVKLRSRILFE